MGSKNTLKLTGALKAFFKSKLGWALVNIKGKQSTNDDLKKETKKVYSKNQVLGMM